MSGLHRALRLPSLRLSSYFALQCRLSHDSIPRPSFEIYDISNPDAPTDASKVSFQNVKDARLMDNHIVRSTAAKGGLVRITSVRPGEIMVSHYPRLLRYTGDASSAPIDMMHRQSVLFGLEHIGALVCVAEARLRSVTFEIDRTSSSSEKAGNRTTVTYARVTDDTVPAEQQEARCHRNCFGNTYVLKVQAMHKVERKQPSPERLAAGTEQTPRPNNFVHEFEIRFNGQYLIMWHRFLEQALVNGIGFSNNCV